MNWKPEDRLGLQKEAVVDLGKYKVYIISSKILKLLLELFKEGLEKQLINKIKPTFDVSVKCYLRNFFYKLLLWETNISTCPWPSLGDMDHNHNHKSWDLPWISNETSNFSPSSLTHRSKRHLHIMPYARLCCWNNRVQLQVRLRAGVQPISCQWVQTNSLYFMFTSEKKHEQQSWGRSLRVIQ